MAGSNFFFNNFRNSMEQDLIESLIVESISIYGHSIHYCPRSLIAKDDIYLEDTLSEYNSSYLVDVYIRSFDSYEGDGTFLSKFNLQIRDQTTFTMARRTFLGGIGAYTLAERPLEGDLIYSEMLKRLMVIKYVNNTPIFYQMGTLQVWDLVCEPFEYSNEQLNTGIAEIDQIQQKYSFSPENSSIMSDDGFAIADNNGNPITSGQFNFDEQLQDVFAENDEIAAEAAPLFDWSETNPFQDPSKLI